MEAILNASILPSAAPPYAIRVWADHRNVYAEVPSLNQPCVIAFPLSEGGLSKVLALLGAKLRDEGGGEPYLRPAVVAKKLLADGITPKDLADARAALLELGLLK
jgi:hypothetical protein